MFNPPCMVRVIIKGPGQPLLEGSWRIEPEESCSRFHVIGQVAITPRSECCSKKYISSPITPASKSSFYT